MWGKEDSAVCCPAWNHPNVLANTARGARSGNILQVIRSSPVGADQVALSTLLLTIIASAAAVIAAWPVITRFRFERLSLKERWMLDWMLEYEHLGLRIWRQSVTIGEIVWVLEGKGQFVSISNEVDHLLALDLIKREGGWAAEEKVQRDWGIQTQQFGGERYDLTPLGRLKATQKRLDANSVKNSSKDIVEGTFREIGKLA